MHGHLPHAHQRARTLTIGCGSESTVGCDSDNWFSELAIDLLGKDAGFGLHLTTGAPEGSCYKYAAKKEPRHPPANILRLCLRSDGGWQWLCGVMEGSAAPWWIELNAVRDLLLRYEIRQR